ncbi:hypothetical protein C1H46_027311 [Malus baccata]|uniref:Uncharacterized protein n=1 Tax=Malus baccata TaxID=106549 RepID=A0A540LL13_MALBA|nr:hypothetical protein C1H46_027311 [Malus baccata]
MDHRLVDPVGPGVSQASASSTSSVALPVSTKSGHHHPYTPDTTSASTKDASRSQQGDDDVEKAVGSSRVCLPASSRDSAGVLDPPEDASFQFHTETLDHTLEWRLETYCRGMGNARRREPIASSSSQSKSEVTTLTAKVADLKTELASYKSQKSLIVQAISQSGIHLLDLRPPSTSEPFQPKHAQNSSLSTFEPVPNLETFLPQDFQPSPNDDPVDYDALFS